MLGDLSARISSVLARISSGLARLATPSLLVRPLGGLPLAKIDSRVHRIQPSAFAHERAGVESEMRCHQVMRSNKGGGGVGVHLPSAPSR
jgi:hypothetical protein